MNRPWHRWSMPDFAWPFAVLRAAMRGTEARTWAALEPNQQILRSLEVLRKHGVLIAVYNMMGLPWETLANLQATMELTEAIAPDFAFCFRFQPLPGAELTNLAASKGLLRAVPARWTYESALVDNPELPHGVIQDKIAEFRQKFCGDAQVEAFFAKVRRACGLPSA